MTKQEQEARQAQRKAKLRARARAWAIANPARTNANHRQSSRGRRELERSMVIEAYGGRCRFCGDPRVLALEVDHIGEVPPEHRRRNGKRQAPDRIYHLLIEAGFPPIVQLLCGSCHNIKTRGGDPAADRYQPIESR